MHYSRDALAEQIADALQGKNLFGDAPNGLFLAAPRRTGKSTFLQADLMPALEKRGILVVYVDFWANARRDPGELLANAIASTVAAHMGTVSRLARKSGLSKLKFGTLEFDLTRIGHPDGASIPDALKALQTTAQAPIALILDEAQHALSSEAGEAAMMALKSARDQMNRPGEIRLMLVLSGSDRDKLLRLVNTGAAPFFGSQISRMPVLGQDFIDHVSSLLEQQQPQWSPVDRNALFRAFQAFGSRPQFFTDALGQALSPLAEATQRLEERILEKARDHERDEHRQMESDYLSLRAVERAVLWRMLERGPRFKPYDSESNKFYAQAAGRRVTKASVQLALESLRERTPSLVSKSARGEYAIEDSAMHGWFKGRRDAGSWPPHGGDED